ncbi:TIGR01457 family HAD-type hydrolase [Solibacillus sp. FSL H8-0538]|uniref:TIGR01457 family HAD-type hydrolase n=1 Tax=Solibacillus sp. FSL H8-0538 TaxID=2921400 RepID=UPI0030F51011
MKRYKAYCFDLDGTVYRGKSGIDSAIRFIHKLQTQGIEPFYVTNNSSKTREQLQQALKEISIDAPLKHIYSSALTTAKYIVQHHPQASVQVIGSDGLRVALAAEGITVTEDQPGVFVMGIDRAVDYSKLAHACVAVQNGAQLIGTNGDVKFPTEIGFLPGNGSFVRLVANVTGVEPVFIGKPSPVMLQTIAEDHGFSKKEMVMVGDNYDTDILCGINFGCDTIHVNTGVTPTEQVRLKEQQPTYVVNSLDEY